MAPSPITAMARRSEPARAEARAMPRAALMEVLEWPTPKVSKGDSSRWGKGARPPYWRMLGMASRRPVRILWG